MLFKKQIDEFDLGSTFTAPYDVDSLKHFVLVSADSLWACSADVYF